MPQVSDVPTSDSASIASVQEATEKAVRQAKMRQGGLKMAPLFRIDPTWFAEIQADVQTLVKTKPGSVVQDPRHPTNWVRPYGAARQFSLYNTSGTTDDLGYQANTEATNKRFWLEGMPALHRLVDFFGTDLISFRLNELMPASGLNAHEEPIESKHGIVLRFHIPVFTNDHSWLTLGDERFHFEEGIFYFFNKGSVHGAINEGETPRYHFVFDMYLNARTAERYFSGRPPGPGFLELDPAERDRLAAGTPFLVQEFVEGRNNGEILLFRRDADGSLKAKRISREISSDPALSIAEGWWGFEEYDGQTFRWAGPKVSLQIEAQRDGNASLQIDLEPGYSHRSLPIRFIASDPDGAIFDQFDCHARTTWNIPLSVHRGMNRVNIEAVDADQPIPGETRLLSFRAFHINLADSNVDC